MSGEKDKQTLGETHLFFASEDHAVIFLAMTA